MSYGNIPGGNDGDEYPGYGQYTGSGQNPGYGQSPGYGQPGSQPPSNYLPWAIVTTLFCCLPAGIVSIVFASQVNGKWRAGDFQGAVIYSNRAKTWAIVSAVLGVIGIVVVLGMGLPTGR
jgi:hypothetical protein